MPANLNAVQTKRLEDRSIAEPEQIQTVSVSARQFVLGPGRNDEQIAAVEEVLDAVDRD